MGSEKEHASVPLTRVTSMTCAQCGWEIDVTGLEPFSMLRCPGCASQQKVPARLGQFLLLDLIGTGGMGSVYHARDEVLGRSVAIKVMLKSLGADPQFVETFRREAQAAAQLNHPHIAQIYSFGQENDQPYIVMELVTGTHLDKLISEGKPLDQVLILRVGIDVAEGLKTAEEAGLMHGDIKPENILLDDKNRAKLVDFGLASFAHNAAEQGVWGTPYYIAPEKIRRQKPDARSDMYSLGATLYHALAGRPPFDGQTPAEVVKARLERDPDPLHVVRPDIHPQVERLVSRMLRQDPAERHQTYAELVNDMSPVLKLIEPGSVGSGRTRKMILRKKSTTTGTIEIAPGQTGPVAPPVVDGEEGKETAPAQEAPLPKAKRAFSAGLKKALKRIVIGGVVVVLVGGLIAGGIWLGMRAKEKNQRRLLAKQEAASLAVEKQKVFSTYIRIQPVVKSVVKAASGSRAYAEKASNAVLVVLGEVIQESPPAQPGPSEVDALIPDIDALTNLTAGVATNPPVSAAVPLGTNVAVSTNRVFGVVTNLPAVPATNTVAATTNVPAASVATLPVPAPPPEPAAPEPEIKMLARQAMDEVREVEWKVDEAREIEAQASTARDESVATPSLGVVTAKAAFLEGCLSSAERLLVEVKAGMQKAEELSARTDAMRVKFQEEKAAKAKADEEEAKRKAREEEERNKAEQKSAEIKNELALAETARTDSLPLIKQHKYDEAVRTLKAQVPDYRSDEGRAAIKIMIDRYSRLDSLKQFVIERLAAEPFGWGWIQDRSPKDVLGADRSGVKVRGKSVPWTEVSTAQMLKFINYSLSSRKLPARAQAEQTFGAAIFCYENGGIELAATFAEKAAQLRSDFKAEAQRLMPMPTAE